LQPRIGELLLPVVRTVDEFTELQSMSHAKQAHSVLAWRVWA